MSALKILGQLLNVIPKVVNAVGAVGKAITRRPPPLSSGSGSGFNGSPIYKDQHSWTVYDLKGERAPRHCIFCKQLEARSSQYCPGVPR